MFEIVYQPITSGLINRYNSFIAALVQAEPCQVSNLAPPLITGTHAATPAPPRSPTRTKSLLVAVKRSAVGKLANCEATHHPADRSYNLKLII